MTEAAPEHVAVRTMPRRRWPWVVAALAIVSTIFAAAAAFELRTSHFQSSYFSNQGSHLGWTMDAGPSPHTSFPGAGPFDLRHGYSRLPHVIAAVEKHGFVVDSQARPSDQFRSLIAKGYSPIYPAKDRAGLRLLDRHGALLFDGSYPLRIYPTFDSIPPILWKSLLFVEDRGLLDVGSPNHNPAVNWPRLFRAATELTGRRLGRGGPVAGASTLATQIEKFRHAPEGRTASARDKIVQMASASVRAYRDGPNTSEARRRIITTYLNAAPFAGIAGFGEVIGFGDALQAWYGDNFDEVNRLLWELEDSTVTPDARHGGAYREVLQLVMAVQRPSYFLADSAGREALGRRADGYLDLMTREGLIPAAVREAARTPVIPRDRALPIQTPSFVSRKAVNAVRSDLLSLSGIPGLYQLDRTDATVQTTIDGRVQAAVTKTLNQLRDPAFLAANGLAAPRLLARGDPAKVNYAFLLYERTPAGNVVRVQADNFEGPFSPIEGAKLELGSTAKLRTLVTYLEIIEQVYRVLTDTSTIRAAVDSAGTPIVVPAVIADDPLTSWVRGYVRAAPEATLDAVLEAAMDRTYSASPNEKFFTGGGVHTFGNFESSHNNQALSVRVALQQSVNLVFIRMMRDVVRFYTNRLPGHPAAALSDRNDPRRQAYLARFADREGTVFLDRFLRKHTWTTRDGALTALLADRTLSASRLAWTFRTVARTGTLGDFAKLLEAQGAASTEARARELFEQADPDRYSLVDRGFLAGIHPLELWLVDFRLRRPTATRAEVIDSSRASRQEVYQWLFNTRHSEAQNQRIRSVLEVEAFFEVHRAWKRLGYPFASLVPSYATAIGSSADRPDRLVELIGILLNDGVRQGSRGSRRSVSPSGPPTRPTSVPSRLRNGSSPRNSQPWCARR